MGRIFLGALVSLLVGFGRVAVGQADYALIQDIVGTHPLLEANGEARVGGVLVVQADDLQVGFTVTALKMATFPVADFGVLTPKADTELTRQATIISQTYSDNGHSTSVSYRILDGILEVQSGTNHYVASLGRAPGEAIAPRDFAARVAGHYKILTAGGKAPEDVNSGASVDLDADTGLSEIWAPFCWPSGVCDPGEVRLPYDQTQVFQTTLPSGNALYTILVVKKGKLLHYAWEQGAQTAILRNAQYNFNGTTVCLEHELQKDG